MTHAETHQRRGRPFRLISASPRLCVSILGICLVTAVAHQPAYSLSQEPKLPNFAEPGDESAQYTVEKLATGLNNPCGLALRPGSPLGGPYDLYFSESGAGRVVRISTDKPAEVAAVVTGFPTDKLAADPEYAVGPLGLAFISPKRLAVGTGGLPVGEDLIRVYSLPDDATPLTYDQADHSVGPIHPDSRTKTGEGDFFSLARIEEAFENALFAASTGDPDQGWVLKASAEANKLADLQPFIPTRRVTGAANPMAVAINPKIRSQYLLVGQMGEKGDQRDSVIGFYGPASGAPALLLKTGLYDIVGLAYSLPSGDLYALDFARHDAKAGGLYRIDAADVDGRQSARAVKIAAIERPTSLMFTADGALYVTAFGNSGENQSSAGALLKITPGPNAPKL